MKRNSSKNADHSAKKHNGFTLVELVVVIAVLAILAGVGAVAYRGYIVYAKKGVDRQLVGEVKNAVSMEVQSNTSVLKLGVGENAVPIGSIFISCPSKDSGTRSETFFTGSGILPQAVTNACGEDFENVLQLKYDGWKSNGAAAGGFVDENGNRYMTSEKMMEYLYNFSDKFFYGLQPDGNAVYKEGLTFMDKLKNPDRYSSSLNAIVDLLNTDGSISDIFEQAGIDDINETADLSKMKNVMIWALADYISENGDTVKQNMADTDNNPLEFDFMSRINQVMNSKDSSPDELRSVMFETLSSFASLGMFSAYLDGTPEGKEFAKSNNHDSVLSLFEDVISTRDDPTKGGSVWLGEIGNHLKKMQDLINDNQNLKPLAEKYFGEGGQASKDADAFVDLASHIHDMQDTFNTEENLEDGGAAFKGGVAQELKKYTGETNGILITAYSDGTTVVSPSDADPVSKNSKDEVPADPAAAEVANGQ